jgi:hypothetical protein
MESLRSKSFLTQTQRDLPTAPFLERKLEVAKEFSAGNKSSWLLLFLILQYLLHLQLDAK